MINLIYIRVFEGILLVILFVEVLDQYLWQLMENGV